jgi:hypothetical protein
VRDDLDEPDQGDAEPDDLPVRAAAIVVLGAALGGALLLSGFGGETKQVGVKRPIVLVSGRDDHGLLVQKTIGLSRLVAGETSSRVPDGTLVQVVATHGEWLQVRALEQTSARGWVNDFYLRGTMHVRQRVAPFRRNTQVEVLDVADGRVRVRSTQSKHVAWVERKLLGELPAG